MQNCFLTNYSEQTFIDRIKHNLRTCSAFYFSVSFIKKAGLVLLLKDIEAAVERGATGKIITSTYQNFTDVESLKSFYSLAGRCPRFECNLDLECFHDDKNYTTLGYHSKGYLFVFDQYAELIVGSSNITRYALLKNIEWDLLIGGDFSLPAIQAAKAEFDLLWNKTLPLDTGIINQYATRLNFAIERWDMDYDLSMAKMKPNFMQRRALKEINRYRAMGIGRALVVAATGSGKTYLAAFDALNFSPKRLLYVVHEGSILRKAIETFQTLFAGSDIYMGLYNGESKEMDAGFVFATNVTMSRSLELFHPDDFDYIIIDECHHATAETYKRIIAYFKPEFLLGLTATPERMDNQDVFELFDKNIPFELRLRDAIINNLIVPFKYYGIRDQLIDYGLSAKDERRLVAQLSTTDHCAFINSQIEQHRQAGKLKALAFCRSITHARMMAEAMSEFYNTAYLTGRNTIGERIRAYNDLQADDTQLEILFTVDILNEGVDIPGVNMVLFLRPTESSTIFIQQLGRGLRKSVNKQYVTVLDFIGNSYKRSVQIAFALGSLSKNFILEKRLIASLVRDNFKALGLEQFGVEVNIDDLSKEEMIEQIENENFNRINYLKQDYFNFKQYINSPSYPRHMDYLNNDCAPDLLRFMNIKISGKKNYSYYNFLLGIGEEDIPQFTEEQIKFVNILSTYLPLVRGIDYAIVKAMLQGMTSNADIERYINEELNISFTDEEYNHAMTYLLKFGITTGQSLLNVTRNDNLDAYANDLLDYGLTRYKAVYGECTGFKLWSSYQMGQVQLKLCKDPNYNQKGTYVYGTTVYIFASIKKDASTEEHLNYKDKFIEPNIFQWECEAGLNEANQQALINSTAAHLFIRKVSQENGLTLPFTYVGTGHLLNPRTTDNPRGSLLFDIHMEESLPDYLQYDFGLEC